MNDLEKKSPEELYQTITFKYRAISNEYFVARDLFEDASSDDEDFESLKQAESDLLIRRSKRKRRNFYISFRKKLKLEIILYFFF